MCVIRPQLVNSCGGVGIAIERKLKWCMSWRIDIVGDFTENNMVILTLYITYIYPHIYFVC